VTTAAPYSLKTDLTEVRMAAEGGRQPIREAIAECAHYGRWSDTRIAAVSLALGLDPLGDCQPRRCGWDD
jgi:hypothetical protein